MSNWLDKIVPTVVRSKDVERKASVPDGLGQMSSVRGCAVPTELATTGLSAQSAVTTVVWARAH